MDIVGNGAGPSNNTTSIPSNNKEDIYESVGSNGPPTAPYTPVKRYEEVNTNRSATKFDDNSQLYSNVVELPAYDDNTADEKSKLLPAPSTESQDGSLIQQYNPKPRIPSTNNYEPVDTYRTNDAKPVSAATDDYSEISQYQPQQSKGNPVVDINPYSEVPHSEVRRVPVINNTNSGYSEVPLDYHKVRKAPENVPKYEPGIGEVARKNRNDYSKVAQYEPRKTSQPQANDSTNKYEPVDKYNSAPPKDTTTEKDLYSNVDGKTVNDGGEDIPIYQPSVTNGSRGIYDTPVDEQIEVPKEIRDLYAVVDKSRRQKQK